MPQLAYTDPVGLNGTLANSNPKRTSQILNPQVAQVDNAECSATGTDGTYALVLTDELGVTLATASYAAVSKSAAQIAAGLAAAALADYTFRGYITNAAVITTDNVEVTYRLRWKAYTLTGTGPAAITVTTTTSPGYTRVALGRLLQWAAGVALPVTTYSDAKVAAGVVYRNSSLLMPLDPATSASGYEGPCYVPVLLEGEINVTVMSGITVAKGELVYHNSTNATWSNVTTGSHVLVEGAQWLTAGTGVQSIYVNLPSET